MAERPDKTPAQPPVTPESGPSEAYTDEAYTDEEEAEVRKRLEDLGYVE